MTVGLYMQACEVKGAKGKRTSDSKRSKTSSFFDIKMMKILLLLTFLALAVESAVKCPRIVTRSQWGARPAKPPKTPIKRPVPKVFIHHSEGSACTTQASCASQVKGIQNYHMDTQKWDDIGYNFLVGEDGNVYEGRGWDLKGAHGRKYNPVSYGISVLGNYMTRVPNAAAQNAVKQLIACGVSLGKISGSYTLHGHRDGVCTSCPGDAFYNLIKTWPRYGGKLPIDC